MRTVECCDMTDQRRPSWWGGCWWWREWTRTQYKICIILFLPLGCRLMKFCKVCQQIFDKSPVWLVSSNGLAVDSRKPGDVNLNWIIDPLIREMAWWPGLGLIRGEKKEVMAWGFSTVECRVEFMSIWTLLISHSAFQCEGSSNSQRAGLDLLMQNLQK